MGRWLVGRFAPKRLLATPGPWGDQADLDHGNDPCKVIPRNFAFYPKQDWLWTRRRRLIGPEAAKLRMQSAMVQVN